MLQIICLGFTGILAYRGEISVGEIVLYQSYFATIVNNITSIVTLLPTITKGLDSVDSIGDVLLAEDIEDNRGKIKLSPLIGNYEFENVSFSYVENQRPVLENFQLKVNNGETVAFVGASGAGKTTIINMIIGFLMPTQGKVLVDDIDLTKVDLSSYRESIAVVPQETLLFSDSLRNNITYGLPNISDEKLKKILIATNLLELVESLPEGVETHIGEKGGKLSGGQRQRISIARAMIREPKVYF